MTAVDKPSISALGAEDDQWAPRSPTRSWWLLPLSGLAAFHSTLLLPAWPEDLLFTPLGVGVILTLWLGPGIVLPLFMDLLAVRITGTGPAAVSISPFADALLIAGQITASWWCYVKVAKGSARLNDPRSATFFLLIVGAGLNAFFVALRLGLGMFTDQALEWPILSSLWLGGALGIMVVVPPCVALFTPLWHELGWVKVTSRERETPALYALDWTWGEAVEQLGLSAVAAILGVVIVSWQIRHSTTAWPLWGLSLLVIVWASLRQGMRGGSSAASLAALFGLGLVPSFTGGMQDFAIAENLRPLQSNFLAQCSVALLVGVSIGWIRSREQRYRQVIGHIPVVLYSVRVPRWLPARLSIDPASTKRGTSTPGALLLKHAELTLVSPACRQVFACDDGQLLGPLSAWTERILPVDRELLLAAWTQLCRQTQPVTCEYRVSPGADSHEAGDRTRWVRDTLAPHYNLEGHLDGWEGVVEDVTEQRSLANDVRRTSAMLQALISHLPAGVYFVQAPHGQPILVNERARQLLGQREDLAAGLRNLPQVYRLHRPDGSEYPWQELPVTKALQEGKPAAADDIIVHRADGRQITLLSWAAPVSLGGHGPDAAVWVLEEFETVSETGR